MAARPVLYVLAGVNGAGKSSIGGHLLTRAGLSWFNPDAFARELVQETGARQEDANAAAWHEGMRRLEQALAQGRSHAFETTLGGATVAARLRAAVATHDVLLWYCGLSSPEQHIARVRARVAAGGHDIPTRKIRERFDSARLNLIGLMPALAHLAVYDNSVDALPGQSVPEPRRLLEMAAGKLRWPTATHEQRATPDWAKPLLEAALQRR
ncbi:AAA family ATPase [Orrella sp. JC864]|uniref:AAA family ATPase n=1 Tax=Orrella sp. JC864 TaxID=3120298 RepID=UPI00300BCBA9